MYAKSENLKRLEELSGCFPYTCPVHDDVVEKLQAVIDMVEKRETHEAIKVELDRLFNYIKK